MTPARNRVLYGGRSSSKSWDAAGFAIFLAQQMKLKFLCTRQFQNRIEDSVYSLLKIQIERFGLRSKFRVLDNKIICTATGSEFVFYGLWRQIDEVKSIESIDIHWSEEAHLLTETQWKVLEPTIRKQGSQHWLIFNPRLATDFVYKRFVLNPPPRTVKRLINYDENPFLSDTMRQVIEAAKAEDEDEFNHIYLGQPKDDDDDAIIKRSWIMASLDAHKALGFEASGTKRIGFDVADSGADKCANVFAHGSVVSWVDEWKAGEDELLKSCYRTYTAAKERDAQIIYDSIGVGASAGAKFKEVNETSPDRFPVRYEKFNAGAAVWEPERDYQPNVKNKDMFANLKAQAWWMLADRFRNTFNAIRRGQQFTDDKLISITSDCPHLDRLIDELATPKRDYDNNGRVKVESKKDLAKREIASPNLADAFVMCYAPGANNLDIWAKLAG
jgi:phage terminase large subunit